MLARAERLLGHVRLSVQLCRSSGRMMSSKKKENYEFMDSYDPALYDLNMARAMFEGDWKQYAHLVNLNTERADLSETKFSDEKGPFRLLVQPLIERMPKLSRDLQPWQKEWLAFRERIDNERYRQTRPFDIPPPSERDEELRHVFLANRTTEADRKSDVHSLDRKLTERIYLLVREANPINAHRAWAFPSSERQSGESIRETAQRVCDTLGLQVYFFGNHPCLCWSYNHVKSEREKLGVDRTKIFYVRAALLSGNLTLPADYAEHRWLTRTEMSEHFSNKHYKALYLANRD
jgi:hypothetical protein